MSGPAAGIPIVILAGSDLRRAPVPSQARHLEFVVAYKGAELRPGGRPLISHLVERVRASAGFGPVYVAGPRRIYEPLVDCPVIDTDGHLGENILAAVDCVRGHHGAASPLGLLACDVLPRPSEIAAMARLLTGGEGTLPALAVALIRAPQDLGVSQWKPRYRLRPHAGAEPVAFLPGHLGIIWPMHLRLGLVSRLLRLAYRERNRDYLRRRRGLVARILGTLLARDLLNLLRLQPPTLTYTVLRHGLGTFGAWRRGKLTLEGFAYGLGKVMVRRRYLHEHGPGCVRVVTSGLLSFATDLDTREEFLEVDKAVREGRA